MKISGYVHMLDIFCIYFLVNFREDYETGLMYTDEEDKDNFYSELKSAAESGWDFSTRWFIVNGTNKGKFFFHFIFLRIGKCLNVYKTHFKYVNEVEKIIKIHFDWLLLMDHNFCRVYFFTRNKMGMNSFRKKV